MDRTAAGERVKRSCPRCGMIKEWSAPVITCNTCSFTGHRKDFKPIDPVFKRDGVFMSDRQRDNDAMKRWKKEYDAEQDSFKDTLFAESALVSKSQKNGRLARVRVNEYGYVEHRIADSKAKFRNWWLVKYNVSGRDTASLNLPKIALPKGLIGKRIRLKVEVLAEESS